MKTLFVFLLSLNSLAFADFQVGERVFNSRVYIAGYVTQVFSGGSYDVKLDDDGQARHYNSYYALDLGPQIKPCARHFCVGDVFTYSMPFIGRDRTGEVIEIFQAEKLIVYGVALQGESKIRYLNSTHTRWMIPVNK